MYVVAGALDRRYLVFWSGNLFSCVLIAIKFIATPEIPSITSLPKCPASVAERRAIEPDGPTG